MEDDIAAAEQPTVVVSLIDLEDRGDAGVRARGLLAPLVWLWQKWRHGRSQNT